MVSGMKSIILNTVKITAIMCGLGICSLSADEGFKPIFDGETLKGWKTAHSEGEGDWGPFRIDGKEKAIHVYKGEKPGSEQESDCLLQRRNTVSLFCEWNTSGCRNALRRGWRLIVMLGCYFTFMGI